MAQVDPDAGIFTVVVVGHVERSTVKLGVIAISVVLAQGCLRPHYKRGIEC